MNKDDIRKHLKRNFIKNGKSMSGYAGRPDRCSFDSQINLSRAAYARANLVFAKKRKRLVYERAMDIISFIDMKYVLFCMHLEEMHPVLRSNYLLKITGDDSLIYFPISLYRANWLSENMGRMISLGVTKHVFSYLNTIGYKPIKNKYMHMDTYSVPNEPWPEAMWKE